MQITRAADYAVRVMVYPEIAFERASPGYQRPGQLLSKILQRLVHQGMLVSQRGSGGGFVLNRAPNQISLLDIVEAIEGPTQLNVCVGESGHCERKDFCAVHPVWEQAQRSLTQALGGVSIAQLAEESGRLLEVEPAGSSNGKSLIPQ